MTDLEYIYIKGKGWVPGEPVLDKKHPHNYTEQATDYFYIVNEDLDDSITFWYGLDSQSGFVENPLAPGHYKFEVWLNGRWIDDGDEYDEEQALQKAWDYHSHFERHKEARCRLARFL